MSRATRSNPSNPSGLFHLFSLRCPPVQKTLPAMVLQQLQMYVSVLRLQAMNLEHHKLQLCLAQACVNRAGHVKKFHFRPSRMPKHVKDDKQLVKGTSESIEVYCSIGRQTNSHTDARLWHASCVLRNSYYVICSKLHKAWHINVQKQNEVLYMVFAQNERQEGILFLWLWRFGNSANQ